MSALRAFRLQKSKKNPDCNGVSSPSPSPMSRTSSQISNGSSAFGADTAEEESQEIFDPKPQKRPRILSDDSDEGSNQSSQPKVYIPDPDVIEASLQSLQSEFPKRDRMDLQDVLRRCDWSVSASIEKLRPSTNARQKFVVTKKTSIKRHETSQEDASDESEGEYNGNGVVYDSDSDQEETFVDEDNLTDDKKKVLHFFNNGTVQELACIQGCSKKKVENIIELRPFEGWGELIQKIHLSRQLNTDMLNSATMLLKMKDAVSKLMEKCEKITRKMEEMVENLTNGDKSRMELTEQPKNLNKSMHLTGYQMIGLNWLVLMHRQSLNGILADEMGLGKTIQAIAFLAHLKEMGDAGPHLIIVPSSTMENWQKEMTLWCPDLKVLNYYGSQDERRHMRIQIVNEAVDFDIILTTYNMVISSSDDRVLFRKLDFHYVIFDEAHMLKNMATSRYENLMRVQAARKLLLTGTPLQNNLIELMSLLVFVMPDMFANKKEQLKKMFALFPKASDSNQRSKYEQDRIAHAKRIMKPFFLRRLKSEVLTELPKKTEQVLKVPMIRGQHEMYRTLVADYKERARKLAAGEISSTKDSGIGLLMNLRKAANHPLLIRNHYDDDQIRVLARLLKRHDSGHKQANEAFIVEDLSHMSDFYIHKTCLHYRCIEHYSLGNHQLCESGKFEMLDKLLPDMKDNDDRVLMFTQFTMVLDIMEQYLRIRGHKYLRLDGSTPVQERQMLIDQFNRDNSIFIFILSTKAGGLGINLTAANTVILHDLDFNPYNDKQAEDRCHRVGQTRPVKVIRFLSQDTIEEGIYSIAQEKLKLEQDLAAHGEEEDHTKQTSKKDLKKLLKIALDVEMSEKQIGDIGKVYTEL